MVAGGAAAYVQSQFNSKKANSYGHYNGVQDNRENSDEILKKNNNVKGISQKKGGLKSLQVLAAILLSDMGQIGARDLLALVGIVVSLSFCVFPTYRGLILCWLSKFLLSFIFYL